MKLITTAFTMLSLMLGIVQPQQNLTNLNTEAQPRYGNTRVDENSFPDAEFRKLVEDRYSKDNFLNDKAKGSEITFDCNGYDVKDFTGIEYFTDVQSLKIKGYKYETLDLTGLQSSATTFGLDAAGNPYEIPLDIEVKVINSPNVNKVVANDDTGNKISLMMNGVQAKTLDVSGVKLMKDFINVNSSIESLTIQDDQPLVRFMMMGVPNLATINGRLNAEEIVLADMPLQSLNFRPEHVYTLDLINTNISNVNLLAYAVNLEWLVIGGNQFNYLNLPDLVRDRVDYHDYSGATYNFPMLEYIFVDSEFNGVDAVKVRPNKVNYVAEKTDKGYVVTIDGIDMNKVLLPTGSEWTKEGATFFLPKNELVPLNYYYDLVNAFEEIDNPCFDFEHEPGNFDPTYTGDENLRNTHKYIMTELTVNEAPVSDPAVAPTEKPKAPPTADASNATVLLGSLLASGSILVAYKKKAKKRNKIEA